MTDQQNLMPAHGGHSLADDAPRVAVIAGRASRHDGPRHALAALAERGVPGYRIDIVGGDADAVSDALAQHRNDLIQICGPDPAGVAALLHAQALGIPATAAFYPELPEHQPAADPREDVLRRELAFGCYARASHVLSPDDGADARLAALGVPGTDVRRWERGVDLERFNPGHYSAGAIPVTDPDARARFNVLYAGPLERDHGTELLAAAFEIARDLDPRLQLVLTGSGSQERVLRSRLGAAVTVLDPIDDERLARLYASADLLVLPSSGDAHADAVLGAQASGLPVLAVDGGACAGLIESGRSGCLVGPDAAMLGAAIRGLARRAALCERLSAGGLLAARRRSWERSAQQLAAAWREALAAPVEVACAA